MLNEVKLIGRLGGDPEVKQMPNGESVANLTLATGKKWKDKNTGEQREKTEWHRIVVFGKLADICGQYLRKGSMVYFCGELETRMWEKDGVKQYTTEIKAKDMLMLGGRDDAQGGGSAPAAARPVQAQRSAQAQAQPGLDSFEDDIPF